MSLKKRRERCVVIRREDSLLQKEGARANVREDDDDYTNVVIV